LDLGSQSLSNLQWAGNFKLNVVPFAIGVEAALASADELGRVHRSRLHFNR
jgi:hypothetical protein